MKPIRLELEGFAGIASGKGKNKVVVDLEALVTADAQMVALVAPNGGGKTTIMDNLHPYRLMPSHASKLTPSGFSFYEHIAGGEGSKTLTWENRGTRYLSILRFRATAKTKRTEAYLYTVGADGSTTPWRNPKTGLESDGKTDTYDEAVEAILGSPEVFFNAQFSAQGKKPIQSMTAGEVKRLIADMIGSSESSELAAKSNDVVKALKPHQAAQQQAVDRLKAQMPDESELQRQLDQEVAGINASQAVLKDAADKVANLTARIVGAKGSQEQFLAAKQQHDALDREFQSFHAECAKAVGDLDKQKMEIKANLISASRDAAQRVQGATNLVNTLKSEVARIKEMADKVPQVTAAKAELVELAKIEAAHQAAIDKATPQALLLEEVQKRSSEIATKLSSLESDGKHLAEALASAQKTASLLMAVPCKGTDLNGRCQLLAQANEAGTKAPEIEVRLNGARTSYGEFKAEGREIVKRISELKAASVELQGAKEAISALHLPRSRAQSLVDMEAAVNSAKESLPGMREKLQAAISDLDAAQQALAKHETHMREFEDEFTAKLNDLMVNLDQKRERLNALRQSLPPLQGGEDVQALQGELDGVQALIKEHEGRVAVHQQAIAKVNAAMQMLGKQQEEVAQAQGRVKAIADEISLWVLLSKALGTDGIIAMTIDDAGPAISQLANELLNDCYGGRFALELVTQRETQAGIAKEDFLIMVDDNHRGESKSIDLMSGGEKVWINECLVRAIALYMAQVADTRSQTLFSDEADGPLDPQRKRQFMAMKRAVLKRGGYEREYLITHTPELLEMCDAVIRIEDL